MANSAAETVPMVGKAGGTGGVMNTARLRPEWGRGGNLRAAASGLVRFLSAVAALAALTGGVCFALFALLSRCPEPTQTNASAVASVEVVPPPAAAAWSEAPEGVVGY